MQRKIVNTKYKLHSIPIINKVKSNVLYSIPCGCVLALLLAACVSSLYGDEVYADWVYACPGETHPESDSSSVTSISGGTSASASASLSFSNPNMTSSAITPGSTVTVSTNVTVSVDSAESYSLSLKVDSTNLTNGNTTIVPGNPNDDTKTNVWGYKWDNASTYTAPSTSGTTLTNSILVPLDSNGAVSFTKNLTFGAKFSTSANAGHYKGSGTLSLVATPKAASIITLADLTQMQQLAEGYAPDACKNTVIPSGQDYAGPYTLTDVRDNNTYTVYKFKDGKCWMTQNLKLSARTLGCIVDRELNSNTSDITEDWIMPTSSTSGFNDDAASNSYYDADQDTGYYSWCAATAGTCSAATSNGANATASICPKGWKLPTGGTSGNTDFYNLFKNMELTISGSLAKSGNTSWGSGDLAKVQGSPYNFAYTGYISNSSTSDLTASYGSWWSRTAYDSIVAYRLILNSSLVGPGTNYNNRQHGFAVRCVAQ